MGACTANDVAGTGEAARTAGSCCMTRSFLSVRSVPGNRSHPGWSGGDVEALPPSSANGSGGKMAEIAAQRAAEERRRQAQARERAERLWARANPPFRIGILICATSRFPPWACVNCASYCWSRCMMAMARCGRWSS